MNNSFAIRLAPSSLSLTPFARFRWPRHLFDDGGEGMSPSSAGGGHLSVIPRKGATMRGLPAPETLFCHRLDRHLRVFNRILVTLNGVEFDSGKSVSRTHQYGPENVFVGAIFGPMEVVDKAEGRGSQLHGVDAGIDMDKLNDVITVVRSYESVLPAPPPFLTSRASNLNYLLRYSQNERRLSETTQRRAAEQRRSKHRPLIQRGPIGHLARGIANSARKMKKKERGRGRG